MKTFGYIILFTVIQAVAALLAIVGAPICFVLVYGGFVYINYEQQKRHFPRWAWLWDNEEDGVAPEWYNPEFSRWKIFVWTALRNSCANFRYVRGVSNPSRPLWRVTWRMFGKPYYAQAGWQQPTGRPVMSAGRDIYGNYILDSLTCQC